jgi:hypothetical protein
MGREKKFWIEMEEEREAVRERRTIAWLTIGRLAWRKIRTKGVAGW